MVRGDEIAGGLMKTILYPGSFDPVTDGHVDIAERAAKIFDRVIVVVGNNSAKKYMFSTELRVAYLHKVFSEIPNIEVVCFNGLLVDAVKKFGADAILRGVRSASDFDYELQMARTNRRLDFCETFLLPSDPALSFISSSMVRELIRHGRDILDFVPKCVADDVKWEREVAFNTTHFEQR